MRTIGRMSAVLVVVVTMLTAVSVRTDAGVPPPVAVREEKAVIAQKARQSLRIAERSLGLQTRFPSASNESARLRYRNAPTFPRVSLSQNAATFILWGAVLAIVLVVLLTLRDNLWSSSRSRKIEAEASDKTRQAAVAARMEQVQLQADDLALRGDFAGAMHLLLLQSVDELRRRLSISIAASLTSREILRQVALPPEGRDVFADIIARVEISWFGSHRPEAEEYAACRRSFDALSGILRQVGLS